MCNLGIENIPDAFLSIPDFSTLTVTGPTCLSVKNFFFFGR